jgi:hypothetical protein
MIESSEMTRKTLASFRTALENLVFISDKACIHMGKVNDPDILVILADFFLKLVESAWCIVSGVYGQKLIVIFRHAGFRSDAGKVAQKLFGQWGASLLGSGSKACRVAVEGFSGPGFLWAQETAGGKKTVKIVPPDWWQSSRLEQKGHLLIRPGHTSVSLGRCLHRVDATWI